MKNYKSPEIQFQDLEVREEVANTCWGYHGTDTKLYCDIPGEGYTSFQIDTGSCALNLIEVKYYDGKGTVTNLNVGDEKYNQLYSILVKSGGNQGNPFSGEGTVVIPDNPNPSWS